jgi:hypothetical protein
MMNCEKFDGDITRMKDDIRELIARSHTPLASPKP